MKVIVLVMTEGKMMQLFSKGGSLAKMEELGFDARPSLIPTQPSSGYMVAKTHFSHLENGVMTYT